MSRSPLAMALALSGAAMIVASAAPAEAKAVHRSPYTYRQTFGTALRLVKVDLGLEVTEMNSEWGFLLFEYVSPDSGKRKNRGSFQLVEVDGIVQVELQVPQMPSYHEDLIVQKLKRKLEEEHGAPPRREKPKDGAERKPDKAPPPKKDEPRDDASDERPRNPDTVRIIEPERDALKKR